MTTIRPSPFQNRELRLPLEFPVNHTVRAGVFTVALWCGIAAAAFAGAVTIFRSPAALDSMGRSIVVLALVSFSAASILFAWKAKAGYCRLEVSADTVTLQVYDPFPWLQAGSANPLPFREPLGSYEAWRLRKSTSEATPHFLLELVHRSDNEKDVALHHCFGPGEKGESAIAALAFFREKISLPLETNVSGVT